jgi:IS30 family transposase
MRSKVDEWLTEDGLAQIRGWARDGLRDADIAKKIGVHPSTFSEYRGKYPELNEALKKGKAPVDIQVEDTLLKSALGFHTTVKKAIKVKTKKQLKDKGTIEEEHVEYYDEDVYIPPSPVAIFFWLKNRRPDKWRDKPMSAKDKKEMELMQARIDALTTSTGKEVDDKTREQVDNLLNDVEPELDDDADDTDEEADS